jgi:hypothetical protein
MAPRGELSPRADAEFSVDRGQSPFDRLRAETESAGDLAVCQSERYEFCDLALSFGQGTQWVATPWRRRTFEVGNAPLEECEPRSELVELLPSCSRRFHQEHIAASVHAPFSLSNGQ